MNVGLYVGIIHTNIYFAGRTLHANHSPVVYKFAYRVSQGGL